MIGYFINWNTATVHRGQHEKGDINFHKVSNIFQVRWESLLVYIIRFFRNLQVKEF